MFRNAKTSGVRDHSAAGQIRFVITTATAATGEAVIFAAVAIVVLSAAAFLASMHSPRVGAALGCTVATNAALLAAHVRLEANHPLRMLGPVAVMGVAYLELQNPTSDQAYSIARLAFSLAFAAEFAGLFFELWNEWPLPLFTICVCLGVMAHAIAPKGVSRWLPF